MLNTSRPVMLLGHLCFQGVDKFVGLLTSLLTSLNRPHSLCTSMMRLAFCNSSHCFYSLRPAWTHESVHCNRFRQKTPSASSTRSNLHMTTPSAGCFAGMPRYRIPFKRYPERRDPRQRAVPHEHTHTPRQTRRARTTIYKPVSPW